MTEVLLLECATQLPPHFYSQDELLESLEQLWAQQHYNTQRLRQFHQALQIRGRYLCQPLDLYHQQRDFSQRNSAYNQLALDLAEQVVTKLLHSSGYQAQQIDFLVQTSVTGLGVPSLEARLMNRLPFRPDTRRLPLFGLGCLGGAAGLARLADLVRGKPGSCGLLLAVELCSLTLQPQDLSPANLVASGLFGDGAAAVLLKSGPDPRPGPRILDSRSIFFPDSEGVMGWTIGSSGFQVVLSPQVPHYAQSHLGAPLLEFLAAHQLTPQDISAWIAHPGGPKVVDALEQSLGLAPECLAPTRASLEQVGNLSSASVLFVLRHFLDQPPPPGSFGLLLAMGPAFCAEVVLLRW